MPTNPSSFPLYERVAHRNTVKRATELITLFLLLSLLTHRLLYLETHGIPWLIAFLCESWFTIMCILHIHANWNLVEYKTYPQSLKLRVSEDDLPPVDIFVTTADPILEPPIIVVNTVLSLMALDYPAHKLACYVSDDGGSALTFYSLVEASKFAKLWVPFCKKYGVLVRAPFRHFKEEDTELSLCNNNNLLGYEQERLKMKGEYDKLVQRIEDATRNTATYNFGNKEFEAFSNIERKNHASIVKVIWENKEGSPDGLPHLVYISREKRPKQQHHYKAGAMNVLARVSGLMTNAPFMLNLDCDMYVNDPEAIMHAMCLLLGLKETKSGFVQFPQCFYDAPGDEMKMMQQSFGRALTGLEGMCYEGTNCFHRRKVIYGSWADEKVIAGRHPNSDDVTSTEQLGFEELQKHFGNSLELSKSAASTFSGSKDWLVYPSNLLSLVDAATEVADCGYEYATSWGKEIGWMYGSTVEDVLTGLKIHSRGWGSIFCMPDRTGFQGCAASDGLTALIQQKRWATGLLEILFSRHNPFLAMFRGRLHFRLCLAYLWFLTWALRSITDLIYALLPAYCIITDSFFLPKGLALCIPLAWFGVHNLNILLHYLSFGASARAWWEHQKMDKIISLTASLFGVFGIIMKLLGLSEPVFHITAKGQVAATGNGGFTFNKSPIIFPAITIVLVHIMALATMLLRFRIQSFGDTGTGLGEVTSSLWVLLCLWTFIEGLFKTGRYGIPASTICKSAALGLLFVQFCRTSSVRVA